MRIDDTPAPKQTVKASSAKKKKKAPVAAPVAAPQQTFSEDDVKKFVEILNYFYKNAKFPEMGAADCKMVGDHFGWLGRHAKTMESHILEVRKVTG